VEFIGNLFNLVIVEPLLNSLLLLYAVLFKNMALAIVAVTVLIRLATYPLTVRQLRMTQAQAIIAPTLEEINRRYTTDPQKRSQETMRLYREHGMSPLGCLGPMVIQLPIWLGLYWAIIRGIGDAPANLIYISQHLYGWMPRFVVDSLPVNPSFAWLNLTQPDPLFILPVLVGVSMWVTQKMMMPRSSTPQQQSTSTMMLWTMPIMFTVLSFSFPSGLAFYWLVSNIMTVVMQYFIIGWGGLWPSKARAPMLPTPALRAAEKEQVEDEHGEPGPGTGQPGVDGQDGGGGDTGGPRRTRRRARRSRSRRTGSG
jgi:YidC/Oxa1 family membrane protein insertase